MPKARVLLAAEHERIDPMARILVIDAIAMSEGDRIDLARMDAAPTRP